MYPNVLWVCLTVLHLKPALGAPSTQESGPIVKLDYGSFQGNQTGELVQFLGIPFAAPPTGDYRFASPQPPHPFEGIRQATSYGPACYQQGGNVSAIPLDLVSVILAGESNGVPGPTSNSEDCLFVNVVKPSNIPHGKKLPVLFWIFGGAFETGDTSLYPGGPLVSRSMSLAKPVIYVSANYRLSALGFLAGKVRLQELGMQDSETVSAGAYLPTFFPNSLSIKERFALQWVHDHIAAFGGDPNRVTIWGESAGAASVGVHLVLDNGFTGGLFHGAFMQSGSPTSLAEIDSQLNQQYFDQLVSNVGCNGNADPISCLRAVPIDQLVAAMSLSPSIVSFQTLALAYQPSVDGQFITRNPMVSIQKGLYAKVSIVTGDCDDEGTFFSLTNQNITTNEQFLDYMKTNYFLGISDSDLAALAQAYPEDVTVGSPFDTGTANAVTPQFKRLSAIQGDFGFQAPRRFFLQSASKTQPAFSFLYKRGKVTATLGSFHGSDIPEFYGTQTTPDFIGTDALINFANTGNPSLPKNSISKLSTIDWKPWGSSQANPPLLTFIDSAPGISITFDTYRKQPMALLSNITFKLKPGV